MCIRDRNSDLRVVVTPQATVVIVSSMQIVVVPLPTTVTTPAAFTVATPVSVSYTHLRAHETVLDLVCRLLLEKKKQVSNTHLQR